MDVRVANDRLVGAVLLAMTMSMLSLPHATDARSSGPPVQTGDLCSDMVPVHASSPQSSGPPYTITTFATCYTPGAAVNGKHLTKLYNLLCSRRRPPSLYSGSVRDHLIFPVFYFLQKHFLPHR